MITPERLMELVHYDPEIGEFRWAMTRKKCTIGALAGSRRGDGYVTIRLDYKRYFAHRLAWLYMTGCWPSAEIDHKDLNPTNNAWQNLRAATPMQNQRNRRVQRNNMTGLKGVSKNRNAATYAAAIKVGACHMHLGSFATAEAAHAAYVAAAEKHFGEFARAA